MSPCDDPSVFGVNKLRSPYSVKVTMDRISDALLRKGATIFARIDHAAAAQQQDLSLPDTELLIFGHPKLGTSLMNSAISIGLDLPLKVLATVDCEQQVWLMFNNPHFLQLRHGFREDLIAPLQDIQFVLQHALKD
ncbi:DUF302 domain-containing protein [uncultured Deefgea sp.]|uniref:DUF302 domain-containing protein n=1 Tax=uncultured Deefgea sp. TaxID=1304914 RepID=UPI002610F56C|nr:DUF302 domain-containing protein [uncultured Deefgea sp.]